MTVIVCVVHHGPPPAPRWGDNLRPKTLYGIESVVEWVEARERPFTASDVWRGANASWSTVVKTLLELREHRLIRRVNGSRAKPGLWLAIDKEWTT